MTEPSRRTFGFTLLEVLAVASILAILAVLAYPNMNDYLARAREVVCMSNMKSITAAFNLYLLDHEAIWPQQPEHHDSPQWDAFWIQSLEDYGITAKTWQCPEIRALLIPVARREEDIPKVHYTPTSFPPIKGIPYRWSTQPWLIEKANAHGKGSLIAFPDGSVKSLFKVLAEQGAR